MAAAPDDRPLDPAGAPDDATLSDEWPVAPEWAPPTDDTPVGPTPVDVGEAVGPPRRGRISERPWTIVPMGLLAALGILAAVALGAWLASGGDGAGSAASASPRGASAPVGATTRQTTTREPNAQRTTGPSSAAAARPATGSSVPRVISVPRVTGLSLADARRAVRESGLRTAVSRLPSPRPTGTVVRQQPGSGGDLDRGGVVRLVVAAPLPSDKVVTPGVVGLSEAAARARLRALGLRWAVTTVASSSVPEGRVKAQRPTQGTQLRKGERVTLTVSSGAPEVDVPDVVGLDEAAARQQLTAAGLVVRVVDRTTADPDEDGMVLEQSPSGGGTVEPRATVTITVGRLA